MKFTKLLKPVRLPGSSSSPVHFSPSFSILLFGLMIIVNCFWPLFSFQGYLPKIIELGAISYPLIMFAIFAGFLLPILVRAEMNWGTNAVNRLFLLILIIPLLGLWFNPRHDFELLRAFFQSAGVLSLTLLIAWPLARYLGTHDSVSEREHEWILNLALGSLLRSGEIESDEARIANPVSFDKPSISTRLQSLPVLTKQKVERQMVLEKIIEDKKREFGFRKLFGR